MSNETKKSIGPTDRGAYAGIRGLDNRFLDEMRRKLEVGRGKGYVGWDQRWDRCVFPMAPTGRHGFFMTRLLHEIVELIDAVGSGNKARILEETADVANFAMMIADIHAAMDARRSSKPTRDGE